MIVSENASARIELRQRMLHGLTTDNLSRYKKGAVFYDVVYPGYKFNLSDVNAAIGVAQIKKVDEINQLRRQAAQFYLQLLEEIKQVEVLKIPAENESSWHLFPIRVQAEKRDELLNYLLAKGVQASVHFKPVHLFSYYQRFFESAQRLPVAESLFRKEISLPLFPAITPAQIKFVVNRLKDFFSKKR